MNKYWIQYKTWVGSMNIKHTKVTAKFASTNDLQEWCNTNGISPEDIVNVVKL